MRDVIVDGSCWESLCGELVGDAWDGKGNGNTSATAMLAVTVSLRAAPG